jgi:GNAT superfamily N-acetyltransferase
MLSLVDRLSNPAHAKFVNRTQQGLAGGRTATGTTDTVATKDTVGTMGTTAIRPVGPEDLTSLGDFFAGLSVESRYLRFFAPVTPAYGLLHLLCGGPADVDAIVAVADGVTVGHAMAADRFRVADVDVAADVGVVVADAWQRRGVGAAMMRVLVARAQTRGVTSLAMDVLPGNRRVLAMIIGHWPDAAIARSPGSLEIRIPLPRDQPRRLPPRPGSEQARPPVSVGR